MYKYKFATEESYNDGDTVFKEGNSGDWIYVIQSGSVEISKNVLGEKVVIEVLKSGDVFGELGFISKSPRTATAKAIGATQVGIIDRNFLDHEMNKLSGSFKTVLQALAARLIKTTNVATQVKLRRDNSRISKVLSLGFKTKEGFIDSFSDNLSADGIFIRTTKPLAKGEMFSLRLTLPEDPKPLNVDCQVCWSQLEPTDPSLRYPGMGAKFVEISKTDRQRLKAELEKTTE